MDKITINRPVVWKAVVTDQVKKRVRSGIGAGHQPFRLWRFNS